MNFLIYPCIALGLCCVGGISSITGLLTYTKHKEMLKENDIKL